MYRQNGFTLVELLIVVAIIGILMGIAMPMYKQSVVRSNRVAVMGDLEAAAAAMARVRSQNFSYSGATLGSTGVFRDYSPEGVAENAKYDLALTVDEDGQGFVITATPEGASTQSGDGALAINHMGQRCWDSASDTSCTPGASGQEWSQ